MTNIEKYAPWAVELDWQPIETAPKDGTSILVLAENKLDQGKTVVQAAFFDGQFYADSKEYIIDYEDGLQASHWQPLPDPEKPSLQLQALEIALGALDAMLNDEAVQLNPYLKARVALAEISKLGGQG